MLKEIRKATVSDADAIAKVHVESWQEIYRDIIPKNVLDKLSVSSRSKEWFRWIESGVDVQVLLENDMVIGFISYGSDILKSNERQKTIEITALYIHPDKWRRGYGALLMKSFLSLFKENEINQISLWVIEKNLLGRSFYEKVGFNNTGIFKIDNNDGVELKEFLYEKLI